MSFDPVKAELGRKVLEQTDHFGFLATGAAWIYDAQSERWILELATPMIDAKGPAWVYERLVKLFSKFTLPSGITLLELRVASPDEVMWRMVTSMFGVSDAGVFISGTVSNGIKIPDLFLFRAMNGKGSEEEVASAFDQRYHELVAA
jgi:hypothetical protein